MAKLAYAKEWRLLDKKERIGELYVLRGAILDEIWHETSRSWVKDESTAPSDVGARVARRRVRMYNAKQRYLDPGEVILAGDFIAELRGLRPFQSDRPDFDPIVGHMVDLRDREEQPFLIVRAYDPYAEHRKLISALEVEQLCEAASAKLTVMTQHSDLSD